VQQAAQHVAAKLVGAEGTAPGSPDHRRRAQARGNVLIVGAGRRHPIGKEREQYDGGQDGAGDEHEQPPAPATHPRRIRGLSAT
jgi:hypothetical protein